MDKLLKLIPTIQSIALLEDNIDFMEHKKKSFIKQGVKNIVGSSLISQTSNFDF